MKDLFYIEKRAIEHCKHHDLEKDTKSYEDQSYAYGAGARWMRDELTKKVERLEKAIWHAAHKQFEKSPEEIEEFIAHIYAGEFDEEFDKSIAECKKDWEG